MICIFLFYNVATGKQTRLNFNKEFKHCNVICFDGDCWLLSELSGEGITHRRIKTENSKQLLRNIKVIESLIGIVGTWIEPRFKTKWKPLWVRSCNEYCRYVSGIDVGFTYNPIHLYEKIFKYNENKNFKILYHWRRANGIVR